LPVESDREYVKVPSRLLDRFDERQADRTSEERGYGDEFSVLTERERDALEPPEQAPPYVVLDFVRPDSGRVAVPAREGVEISCVVESGAGPN
jgi:hypothetical protein